MKLRHAVVFAAVAACAAVLCHAEDGGDGDASGDGQGGGEAPFDRYQTIINRMPFGIVPANFDPTVPAGMGSSASGRESGELTEEQRTEEEQRLAGAVRISVLNVTPSGEVAVGFTDSSTQVPAHYYMTPGQTRDGWTVVSANPSESCATLSKDGIEVTLKLGEGTAGEGGGKKSGRTPSSPRMNAPAALPAARGLMAGAAPRHAPGPAAKGGALAQLRERRQREESEKRANAERAAKLEEERRRESEENAAQREQQREALLQLQEVLRQEREQRELDRQQREQERRQRQAEMQNANEDGQAEE